MHGRYSVLVRSSGVLVEHKTFESPQAGLRWLAEHYTATRDAIVDPIEACCRDTQDCREPIWNISVLR